VYHSTLGLREIQKKKKDGGRAGARTLGKGCREREFFIDNLMVRIHLILERILVDRPCAMGVRMIGVQFHAPGAT